jgi:ribosomal protein L7/L12
MSGDYEVMELRARVLELEGKIEFLYKHLGVTYLKEITQADQKVADVLRNGSIIEAIKVYREIHNVGLAEAKQAVEEIKSRFGL